MACALLFNMEKAQAAKLPTASVSNVNVFPGEIAEISVSLTGNPGLAAWMFEISWDASALSLDTDGGTAQVGEAFASGTFLARQKDGGGGLTVSWYSVRNVSSDGELFSLKYKASPSASGSFPVNITCVTENTINTAEQLVPVTCNSGSVVVAAGTGTIVSTASESSGESRDAESLPSSAAKDETPQSTQESTLVEFTDVPQNAYYYDAVQWAVKNGVTDGIGNNNFGPSGKCTRAQTVTFLWRAAGSPEPTVLSNPFSDVKADSYYYKAVLWAVAEGITNGTGADTFSPDAIVSRAQTVTFLWRASGSQKAEGTSPFNDLAKDAYYANAVQWAVEHKITGGTGANTFSPSDSCIRAQIVTFLYRNAIGGEGQ